ncbi:MAG TPA: AraC family transcriptional regulator [bacterium]|nr:AraC family transcriptional regulator [bacterium]
MLRCSVKEKTGRSVMEYYKITKLEKAKELIREGDYTFTQIAAILNYSSLHYFSKIFKRYLGMTPTEYSSSVKLRL